MPHPYCRHLAVLMIASACAVPAMAATGWNESERGDLSDDGMNPTPVTVAMGANIVQGTMGGGGPTTDRDYFTLAVPQGAVLSAVVLNPGSFVSGGASFFAIQTGLRVTTSPTGAGVDDLLAYSHYGLDAVGTNLLSGLLPAAYGGVLPSGDYAFWVQETGSTVNYSFDFAISAVPEPATTLLLAAGAIGLAARHRRHGFVARGAGQTG